MKKGTLTLSDFRPFLMLVAGWAGLCVAGCSGNVEQRAPADRVVLQLKWSHQAQFAGFYTASAKGFYREEGIDPVFLEGGAGVDSTAALQSGKAQFAVLAPEQILIGHTENISLTAISVIFRKSAVVYVAHAGSGIVRPSDFLGKTVACRDVAGSVKDFEFQFFAMMNILKLPLNTVRMVPFEYDHQGFIDTSVDVTPTYSINGAIKLKRKGLKLQMIWPDDYGVHCFSDTLAAMPDVLEKNPDLVYRFLKASLRGWRYALGNPDEAVDITMAYVRNKDRSFQAEMMEALAPLVHTGEDHIGWMREKDWTDFIRLLEKQKVLKKAIADPKQVYTLRFLEQIYKGTKP